MAYTDYNWIADSLAVGSFVYGAEEEFPFDAVLSMETSAPLTLRELVHGERVQYQWRSIVDGICDEENDAIVERFDAAAAQIDRWLREGKRVLVHCYAGVSRAVTAATWYLVRYEGLSWDEALERVRAARPVANPNIRFEIPLRLAAGERLEEDWLAERIRRYCERNFADYQVQIDPEEIWETLEWQGTLRRRAATG